MRSRFSRSAGNGVSFFAFQDIITGTTGVLIVITIFLALNLDEVITISTDSDPAALTQEQLSRALEEVALLKVQVARLQVLPAEDEITLRRMVDTLRQAVAELTLEQQRAEGVPDAEESPFAREVRLEQLNLKAVLTRLQVEEKTANVFAAEATTRLRDLENAVKDAENILQQARDKNNILRLIPERSDTSKQPLLVSLTRDRMELHQFDRPEAQQATSLPELLGLLRKFSSSGHYVVLYCKPSSAVQFEDVTDAVRSAGFEIGYDLIPEAIELNFSPQ